MKEVILSTYLRDPTDKIVNYVLSVTIKVIGGSLIMGQSDVSPQNNLV